MIQAGAKSPGTKVGEPWMELGCLSVESKRQGDSDTATQAAGGQSTGPTGTRTHREWEATKGPSPSSSGVPRPRPSQGRGMEGLKLGTWVSIMGTVVHRHPRQSWPQRRESSECLTGWQGSGKGLALKGLATPICPGWSSLGLVSVA